MGTSCWICRRVSILSHRWMADTGATRHTSTRRAVRLRTHAGVAVRKLSSSPCSSCATHRAGELAAGDTSVGFGPTCSGLHSLRGRLAITARGWPTIIDFRACFRPTLMAPEPTLLRLGLQPYLVGAHDVHRSS